MQKSNAVDYIHNYDITIDTCIHNYYIIIDTYTHNYNITKNTQYESSRQSSSNGNYH